MLTRVATLAACAGLAACHESGYYDTVYYEDTGGYSYTAPPPAGDEAANGVFRGVLDEAGGAKSLQAHVLDGLVIGFGLDDARRYSGVVSVFNTDIDGSFQRRDSLGETVVDYDLSGFIDAHDEIDAGLFTPSRSAGLSLFYSDYDSEAPSTRLDLAGIWWLDNGDFSLSLTIDNTGRIEGYDDAGCGYFGWASQPDRGHNLFEMSIEVEGCALGRDYAIGIGSLEGLGYDATLVLPVWLDDADRVESWVLRRG